MKKIMSWLTLFLSSPLLLVHGEIRGLRRTQGSVEDERLLEDTEANFYGYDDENDDEYNLYNWNDSTNGSFHDNNATKFNIIIAKAEQYKNVAESTAWEFYETAPAEWTTSQWDLVFALFGSVLLSCCLASMCCAYFCWYNDHDDELSRNTNFHSKSQRTPSLDNNYMRYEDEFSITSESLHDSTVASPISIERQRNKRYRVGRNCSSRKRDDESIDSCESVFGSTVASKSVNALKTPMFRISEIGVARAPERAYEGDSTKHIKHHTGVNFKSLKKTTKARSNSSSLLV
ncbi:hypothetical protein ACHAXS_013138 [Conticribra weissflogii]